MIATRLGFALDGRIAPGDLDFDVEGELTDVTSETLVPGRPFAARSLTVRANPGGIEIGGEGTLSGVRFRGTWRQDFGPGSAGRSRVEAGVELSQRFLDAFSILLPPGSLRGEGIADVVLDLARGQATRFSLVSGLERVTLAIPGLGWTKPATAKARFTAHGTLGRPAKIEEMTLDAPGLALTGSVTLAEDGRLDRVDLPQIRVGGWFDGAAALLAGAPGEGVKLSVLGGRADLRGPLLWLALTLALADAGIAFTEINIMLRRPDSRAHILEHSPSGRVPTLLVDGQAIWDSLAILEYLAETHPKARLWPADRSARALARSVSAEMHSGFAALRRDLPMDIRTQIVAELPYLRRFARALAGDARFRYILGLQEVAATAMADGFAQASGGLGVVNVHICCGLGNAMGMLYNAWCAGTPLLLTAGQQDRRLLLEEPVLFGDMVSVTRPWTKWAHEVGRAADMPAAVRRAAQTALTPPTGPVFLSLPVDVQSELVAEADLSPPCLPDRNVRPAAAQLERAAAILAGAAKPAILAGSRVTSANASAELARLAERLGAPVMAECGTSHGRTPLQSGHPLCDEALPLWSGEVHQRLSEYDALLLVGLNVLRPYIYEEPARAIPKHVRLVQLDENPWELAKNYPVEAALWGFLFFYVSCLVITWQVYTRKGGLLFDVERGGGSGPTLQPARA